MKKFITLSLATILLCGMYSCKKTFRCTCYGGITGGFVGQTQVKATNYENAKIECDKIETNNSTCLVD